MLGPLCLGCASRLDFESLLSFLHRLQPDLLEPDAEGVSDADYIVMWLREQGYHSRVFRVEALDYGSLPRRERLYWLGWLDGLPSAPEHAQTLLDNMRLPREPDLNKVIGQYLVDHSLQTFRQKVPSQDDPGKHFKFKDEHLALFDKHGYTWPAPRGAFEGNCDSMEMRPYECVWFANTHWPYMGMVNGIFPIEFMDANESIGRSCGGKSSAWKRQLGTLTCNAKMIR